MTKVGRSLRDAKNDVNSTAYNCQKTGRKGFFVSFYHSDPMLKSVDNLKASPEYIAGAPVEVSIDRWETDER